MLDADRRRVKVWLAELVNSHPYLWSAGANFFPASCAFFAISARFFVVSF